MHQPKPVDAALLSETIDEILEWIKAIPPGTKKLSVSDTDLLKKSLEKIQPVVCRLKQNHVQGDKLWEWLRRLKSVVNDLIELVEENSAKVPSPPKREIRSPFNSPSKSRAKPNNPFIEKVIKELQDVATESLTVPSSSEESRKKKEDEEEETKLDLEIRKSLEQLVGREKEKKEIIDQLISLRSECSSSDDSNVIRVPVVTIVGFEGIGKTELANLICWDQQVKDHFGDPIWIDRVHLTESIDKLVIESPTEYEKGYFVVLNDLRSEVGGKDLLKLHQVLTLTGRPVKAILITTSSKLIANNITASLRGGNLDDLLGNSPDVVPDDPIIVKPHVLLITVKPHVLQGLNQNDSWSLYLKIRKQSSIDVKEADMEQKIVMGCGGIPSWIIMAATFVNKRVVDPKVSRMALKEDFLQEMKFRFYDKLPRLQKLCFAFFSLFPRDHLMDVERIIRLLTAEGGLLFLNKLENTNDTEETVLRRYFNDFVGRPVFKDMEEDERGVVKKCRMQHIMHDLACFVADEEENIMVDPEGEKVRGGMLRASFDFTLDDSRGIPDSLFHKAKKLRAILLWRTHTLIPNEMKTTNTSTCENIFKNFKTTLRLLDLHDLGITALPTSIEELINLRYLDLSLNKIEKLPNAITKLYKLETLKLSHCYFLEELPKNIEDLISLKHLELEGCLALTHMPRKIHKLTSLQTLSLFVVSEEDYHLKGLGKLSKLNNLRGNLEIIHLERLNLKLSNSKEKCIELNKHLERVTLRWGHDDDKEDDRDNATMDSIQLHSDSELRSLFIVGYKGTTLSNWLSSIQCLVKLSLYDCTSCVNLPKIDQLPKLRFLEILRLDNLEYIEDNKDDKVKDNKQGVYFPSLEELVISDCPKLKSWWKTNKKKKNPLLYYFPCISKLHVSYCPKLTSMPLYPSLDEELILVDSSLKPLVRTILNGKEICNQFSKLKSMQIASIEDTRSPEEQWLQCFSSLEKLEIREWKHLVSLPKGFGHLTSLRSLTIENCQEINLDLSESEWEGLRNLRSLVLRENLMIKSLPLGVDKVTSLQVLELHNCPEMSNLPENIGELTSLSRLVISQCHKLASLPKGLGKINLDTLIILDCTLLLPRCQRETGDDWSYISHAKNIQVMETLRDI